jgi:uncharacterized membrane protein YphA (DoxX/SURF4 family)
MTTTRDTMERMRGFSSLFLRLALGLSFLSALADRFGLWGAFGRPNVSWGSFARFVAYTGKLNWFLPEALMPALAIMATCAEALFGLCLVIGWHTRTAALLSGILLILFGGHDDSGFGSESPSEFFCLFGRRRSLPFGNVYGVSRQRGQAASLALNCRSLP